MKTLERSNTPQPEAIEPDLLRTIFEQATEGIFVADSNGRFVAVNRRGYDMLGYSQAEILRLSMLDLIPVEDRAEAAIPLAELQAGKIIREEGWLRHKEGHRLAIEVNARALPDGRLVGFVREITERKQVEEALRKTTENMAAAQRIAHIGSWEIELTPALTFVSPQLWSDECYRIFGLELGLVEINSDLFYSRVHPDDREFIFQVLRTAIRESTEAFYEYRLVRPDGSLRYIQDRARVVRDEATGRPLRVIGTVQDITARKEAEMAQAELEEQLRQAQKMESIGQLAGGVAHDFNNLLTVIQGYAELMQVRLEADDPLRWSIEQIQRAANSAAALTRQLLAFSRKQMLAPTSLDLNELVLNLHKMLKRLIGEDILLETHLAPRLNRVLADPGQLEQVLLNLTVNARDAMPTGGSLIIETANVELNEVYLSTHLEAPLGPAVMLAITDTGHGMDKETQAHIFEPFFTTKAVGQGTGLGLATVYGIIKQSGGDIHVYSEPGQGATFKIYLPAVEITSGSLSLGQLQPEMPRGSETILLVEDEDMIRNLILAILEKEGYTLLQASRGKEALALVQADPNPIDLLITDVVMPEMSGRILAEQLATLRPGLRVLYISGYTDDAVVRHGLLAAEVDFLSKPFSPIALITKVRHILDR